MAHKVLYRQFRPRIFDDVYGQEHVTDVLKRQISSGNISHAYLFSGPRGTGKTSTAKILACALNCACNKDGNPCMECEECRESLAERFVDIIEMDAASNNGVDNIRDIREKISLLPAKGKYKVYIIDEVHMLSGGAFNALLKTLEEPPAHAVFILATTELRKVPKTILSRCQQYDFRRISYENIIRRLAFVADSADINYEERALAAIARAAEGAMRDALSMLDMCAAAGDVTESTVTDVIGIADSENTAQLCRAILDGDAVKAVVKLDEMIFSGIECEHILRDCISFIGDEVKTSASDTERVRRIVYSLDVLIAAGATFRYSVVPKAQITSAVVRASLPMCSGGGDTELRLATLEKKVDNMVNSVNTGQTVKRPEVPVEKKRTAAAEVKKEEKPRPAPVSGEYITDTVMSAFDSGREE